MILRLNIKIVKKISMIMLTLICKLQHIESFLSHMHLNMASDIVTGCLVESTEVLGSPSTVSVTSTWCWSPTSQVQGISWGPASKGLEQSGWAWVATGVRTGSQTLFWLVSHSHSASQPVIVALLLHGTSSLPTGSLVKPSLATTLGSEGIHPTS